MRATWMGSRDWLGSVGGRASRPREGRLGAFPLAWRVKDASFSSAPFPFPARVPTITGDGGDGERLSLSVLVADLTAITSTAVMMS